MTPVFQTVVDKDNGNCMQAAIASMFDMELDDVPNFVEWSSSSEWYFRYCDFMESMGFDVETVSCNLELISKIELYRELANQIAVSGAIYASVKSSIFDGGAHAVLINNVGVVIHDPNPNQFFLGLDVVDSGHLITYERLIKPDWGRVNG